MASKLKWLKLKIEMEMIEILMTNYLKTIHKNVKSYDSAIIGNNEQNGRNNF